MQSSAVTASSSPLTSRPDSEDDGLTQRERELQERLEEARMEKEKIEKERLALAEEERLRKEEEARLAAIPSEEWSQSSTDPEAAYAVKRAGDIEQKKVVRKRLCWMVKLKHREFFEDCLEQLNYKDSAWVLRELFKLLYDISVKQMARYQGHLIRDHNQSFSTSWWKLGTGELIELLWYSLHPDICRRFITNDDYLLLNGDLRLAAHCFDLVPTFVWPSMSWKQTVLTNVAIRMVVYSKEEADLHRHSIGGGRTNRTTPKTAQHWVFSLVDAVPEDTGFSKEWKERTKEKCLKVVYKHDWRITESGLQAPGREDGEPVQFGWDPKVGTSTRGNGRSWSATGGVGVDGGRGTRTVGTRGGSASEGDRRGIMSRGQARGEGSCGWRGSRGCSPEGREGGKEVLGWDTDICKIWS